MVGILGFILGVPVAVLAWGIRKFLARRQEAGG
jgi:predicted PurR-regulated permease PerM